MDLIDRYLAAIARQLPAKQAADIRAELGDVLMSRVEDQEARLGRPLVRAEVEALLIDFGNPLTVAGRYRKVQHLIGPEVFPYWWAAIKIMLAILAGIYLVLLIIGAVVDTTPLEWKRHVPSIVPVAIYLFGLITLGAAAFERFGKVQMLQKWKPSQLPPAVGKRRTPFELGFEIAWNVVFLAWWLGAFRFHDLLLPPYPAFLDVSLAPVWLHWKWAIVAYGAAEIAADIYALARPNALAANLAILAVRYAFGMALLGAILQAGHWLTVNAPTLPEHALAIVRANFDKGMGVGITVTIIAMGARVALETWRFWRARQLLGAPGLAQG
jgi:hypothetical protein